MNTRILCGWLAALATVSVLVLSGCGRVGTVVSADNRQLTYSLADGSQETVLVASDADVTLDGEPAQLNQFQAGDSVRVITEQRDGGKHVATLIQAQSNGGDDVSQPATEREIDSFNQPVEPPASPKPPLTDEGRDHAAPLENARVPEAEANRPGTRGEAEAVISIEGEITAVDEGRLMVDQGGTVHSLTAAGDATVMLDGKDAQLDDLEPGFMVKVQARIVGENMTADVVDATSQE